MTMTTDDFTKLFKYMQRIEHKLDDQIKIMATKTDIDRLETRFDSIEKQFETYEAESLVMGRQLSRHDRWIHEVAHKVDHKLKA